MELIRLEADSYALVTWLDQRQTTPLVASTLIEVELPRAPRRGAPAFLAGVLSRLHRVEVTADIRATAAYHDPTLRSLDAIHLAAAEVLIAAGKPMSAFVTYDQRLAAAAQAVKLTIAAPR